MFGQGTLKWARTSYGPGVPVTPGRSSCFSKNSVVSYTDFSSRSFNSTRCSHSCSNIFRNTLCAVHVCLPCRNGSDRSSMFSVLALYTSSSPWWKSPHCLGTISVLSTMTEPPILSILSMSIKITRPAPTAAMLTALLAQVDEVAINRPDGELDQAVLPETAGLTVAGGSGGIRVSGGFPALRGALKTPMVVERLVDNEAPSFESALLSPHQG